MNIRGKLLYWAVCVNVELPQPSIQQRGDKWYITHEFGDGVVVHAWRQPRSRWKRFWFNYHIGRLYGFPWLRVVVWCLLSEGK